MSSHYVILRSVLVRWKFYWWFTYDKRDDRSSLEWKKWTKWNILELRNIFFVERICSFRGENIHVRIIHLKLKFFVMKPNIILEYLMHSQTTSTDLFPACSSLESCGFVRLFIKCYRWVLIERNLTNERSENKFLCFCIAWYPLYAVMCFSDERYILHVYLLLLWKLINNQLCQGEWFNHSIFLVQISDWISNVHQINDNAESKTILSNRLQSITMLIWNIQKSKYSNKYFSRKLLLSFFYSEKQLLNFAASTFMLLLAVGSD